MTSAAAAVAEAEAPCVFQHSYLPDEVDCFTASDRLLGTE